METSKMDKEYMNKMFRDMKNMPDNKPMTEADSSTQVHHPKEETLWWQVGDMELQKPNFEVLEHCLGRMENVMETPSSILQQEEIAEGLTYLEKVYGVEGSLSRWMINEKYGLRMAPNEETIFQEFKNEFKEEFSDTKAYLSKCYLTAGDNMRKLKECLTSSEFNSLDNMEKEMVLFCTNEYIHILNNKDMVSRGVFKKQQKGLLRKYRSKVYFLAKKQALVYYKKHTEAYTSRHTTH